MAGGGEGCAGLEGLGVSAAVPLPGLEWRSVPSAALASPACRLPWAAASLRPPPHPPGAGGGPPRPAVPSGREAARGGGWAAPGSGGREGLDALTRRPWGEAGGVRCNIALKRKAAGDKCEVAKL